MSKLIWLRDTQQTATVEWYVSEGKYAGLENVREEWMAVPVAPSGKPTGFGPPRDAP